MRLFIRFAVVLATLLLPFAASAAVRMQFGHFAPLSRTLDGTTITMRVNGVDRATFRYGEQRGYVDLGGTGVYQVELVRNGVVFAAGSAQLNDGQLYSAIALGNNVTQPVGFLLTQDLMQGSANQAVVRVINVAAFSANQSQLDVAVRRTNGQVFAGMSQVPYATPSNPVAITPETAALRVTNPAGTQVLSGDFSVAFPANSITTLIVAGDNANQPVALYTMPGGAAPGGGGSVDYSVNGAWTTGNATGQGIVLLPIPAERRLVGSWYTFAPGGGSSQQWYTLDSCRTPVGQSGCAVPNGFNNRTAVLSVYAVSGGTFLGSNPVTTRTAGTLTITFQSCSQATATYDVDGRQGSFTMSNLIAPPNCTIP